MSGKLVVGDCVERFRSLFCDEIEVEYLRPQREVVLPAAKPS